MREALPGDEEHVGLRSASGVATEEEMEGPFGRPAAAVPAKTVAAAAAGGSSGVGGGCDGTLELPLLRQYFF